MIQKLIYCFAFILISSQVIIAQTDDIESEIRAYDDSPSYLISKARRMLLDKYIGADMAKVKELRTYLQTMDNPDYLALYPGENWLIMYRTGEYNELLEDIFNYDSLYSDRLTRAVKPLPDDLYRHLYYSSRDFRPLIEGNIKNASLSQEDQSFLILYFHFIIMRSEEDAQAQLNSEADKFLNQWPNSKYSEMIRNEIRVVFVRGNWGVAFDFFLGADFITGPLSNHFSHAFSYGHGFDVAYKNWELYLRNHLGTLRSKRDEEYSNGIRAAGTKVDIYQPEVSLGYGIHDSHRLKLSPFVGISGIGIDVPTSQTNKTPELEELDRKFTRTYVMGCNVDIKLGTGNGSDVAKNSSYGFIRVRYTYSLPQFHLKYDGHSGYMHSILIGIGGIARGQKRKL